MLEKVILTIVSLTRPSFPMTILPIDSWSDFPLCWMVGQVFDAIEALASVFFLWVLINILWRNDSFWRN